MGHGHEAPYKVPDYKVFKVCGCPKMEALERALACKNLKDPWIRNEVWRYHPGFGSPAQRARLLFFRGFRVGLALTVLTVIYDKTLGGGDQHHHHPDQAHDAADQHEH